MWKNREKVHNSNLTNSEKLDMILTDHSNKNVGKKGRCL